MIQVCDTAATAASWHTLPAPVEPDPARHERYTQLISIFDQLAEQVDPVFRRLQEFSDQPELT